MTRLEIFTLIVMIGIGIHGYRRYGWKGALVEIGIFVVCSILIFAGIYLLCYLTI